MKKGVLMILVLLLSSFTLNAQATNNSDTTYPSLSSYSLTDVENAKNTSVNYTGKPLTLLVFLSPECPLCQNYTLTLNQISKKYQQKVNVYGIIPGNAYTLTEIKDFGKKYNIGFKLLKDEVFDFTNYVKATVTPQAILITDKGRLVYSGAIDNWMVTLGKKRLKVTKQYVQDAIEQCLAFAPVAVRHTQAIGCRINDL